MHNDLAGDPYCDHAHDGFGFLTMHAALSLRFEKVLQTVKPDVTLPYWDYTIDMHAVGMAGGDAPLARLDRVVGRLVRHVAADASTTSSTRGARGRPSPVTTATCPCSPTATA